MSIKNGWKPELVPSNSVSKEKNAGDTSNFFLTFFSIVCSAEMLWFRFKLGQSQQIEFGR